MTNFKIGDIVEVDWSDPNNSDLKDNKYFQGTMKVESVDSKYLHFTFQSTGLDWKAYKTRFKLVERAKEPKPAKKPHAWAVVNKQDNSIDSVWTTRSKARNNRDGWVSAYKIKKVFLEFAE